MVCQRSDAKHVKQRSRTEHGVERRWERGGKKELAFDNAHAVEGIRPSSCMWVASEIGAATVFEKAAGVVVTGASA
jgi:hypothetical protein